MTQTVTALSSLLTHAAVARLDDLGWIRVTGEDRVRWLNGMVTNSIQALAPGEGCYNFFLNAQGRIQGDATTFLEADAILLETDRQRVGSLMAMLDRFIIMDDVELTDLSPERHGVLLAGPAAESILTALGLPVAPHAALRMQRVTGEDPVFAGVEIVYAYSPLAPRYELWTSSETAAAAIGEALISAGAAKASAADLEQLRMLEGTPLYGTDIREKELPQETAQTRALHFAKGCYLGQEIVERIRSRGNVHRTFSGFVLTGELPSPGTALTVDEKPVGELTSVARIELAGGPVQIGLGYIRREALERGSPIVYAGGTAAATSLPYPV